jgi:hypothetical protein
MTQSRNEPCACGSGKRYKNCHGKLASSADAPPRVAEVDFVIAGTQKGGTTTLDLYMRENAGVAMAARRKEVHFFDNEAHFSVPNPGYAAYHANFAPRMAGQLLGETTPIYMYWEPAAARMAKYNPALKIIVVLRNPILRAYSHWNMARLRQWEKLPFLEAVKAEPERARAAQPLQMKRFSYVDRGFYTRQLQRLWRRFPVAQTLVLRTEALQAKPDTTLARVAEFLHIAPFAHIRPKVAHVLPYEGPISADAWSYLADLYMEDIRELEGMLGWDCSSWLERAKSS